MKNIKYIIIILIIVGIIVALALTLIISQSKKETGNVISKERGITDNKESVRNTQNIQSTQKKGRVNDISTYIVIDDEINKFLSNIPVGDMAEHDNIEAYNLLDENYVKRNNITQENVLSKFNKYKEMESYKIAEMYEEQYLENDEPITAFYYLNGIVRQNGKKENVYSILKHSYSNNTYSIEFITVSEYKKLINNNDNKIGKISIAENDYNKIETKKVSDYDMCLAHFNDYISEILNNPNEAYNLLSDEYKKANNLPNVESYKQYIQSKNITTGVIMKCSVQNYEYNTLYTCQDDKGNTYNFYEEYPMEYTIDV